MPRAYSWKRVPMTPNFLTSIETSEDARSPIVAIPSFFSFMAVFSPIHNILCTFNGARKLSTAFSGTTVKPSGFLWSLAILATSLFGAMPIEQVRLSFHSISCLMLSANLTASSKSWTFEVTSRNASSSPHCWNLFAYLLRIVMIFLDTSS